MHSNLRNKSEGIFGKRAVSNISESCLNRGNLLDIHKVTDIPNEYMAVKAASHDQVPVSLQRSYGAFAKILMIYDFSWDLTLLFAKIPDLECGI